MSSDNYGIFNLSQEEYKTLILNKIEEIFQASQFMQSFKIDNFRNLEINELENILIRIAELLHFETNASELELDVLNKGTMSFYLKINNIYKEGIRDGIELDEKQEITKIEKETDNILCTF